MTIVTFLHLYSACGPLGGAVSRTDQSGGATSKAQEKRGMKRVVSHENSHSAVKVTYLRS